MTALAVVLRLSARDLRGGLHRFRVFLACLTLGVAAIAGVGSFGASVLDGVRADARRLLGGDVDLRLAGRTTTDDERAYLERTAAAVSEVIEMRAMVRPATPIEGARRKRTLVELKAVDGRYPLVGAMRLDPDMPLDAALAPIDGRPGAVVDANLLGRLGMALGQRLSLGEVEVEVRATVAREPDRVASVFSLGPRLMIARDALAATDLVRPGSRVHSHTRVRLSPEGDRAAWTRDLKRAFPGAGWRIRGIEDAAPGVRRFIDRMTLFLTFVGLTALVVGGIGVANAVAAYVDGKVTTIAVLRCLGATGGTVFRIYLLHVLALGLVGIGLGLGVGGLLSAGLVEAVGPYLPIAPRPGLFVRPLALAAAFGSLTVLAFALPPLAVTREVPAADLFRHRIDPPKPRLRPSYLAITAGAAAALAALAVFTASDRWFAAWFVGGTVATLLVLRLGALLVERGAARLGRVRAADWRLALANLHRPGAATPGVMQSLGTGLAVLVAVALIEGNLNLQLAERLPEEAPAFFFIDIQPDQAAAFDAVVAAVPGTRGLRRVPSVRGRIVEIAGVPVEAAAYDTDVAWAVRGDRSLTYAALPPEDAAIVGGQWWPADYRGPPLISLDAGLAQGFHVGVGDTLTLNVLGRRVTATIASLREIDWRSLRFDFAIVFSPGVLEGAPQTHIAAVRVPPAAEEALEAAVSDTFANISAIRVRDALEAARRLLAGIGGAVRGTALVTLVTGVVVLAGAIAAGRQRRGYEAVVLKVLGATRRRVLKILLLEYGLLGLAAGLVGTAAGTATAWAVVVHLMRSEWTFLPETAAVTAAAAILLSMVFGFAGTWRALGEPAAPHLRNE